MAGNVAAAVAL
jgi:hypothetical protein